MVWDEHGVFSPDGQKILLMTSYPYQADTNSYHTFGLKTEFMIMNIDGTGLQQLTHFCDTAYYLVHPGIAATGFWRYDGKRIYAQSLVFPDYNNWIIDFYSNCGNSTMITSINNSEPKNTDFSIYPNPANNELNIKFFSESEDVITLEAYDVVGKLIMSKYASVTKGNNLFTLDVAGAASGMYFMKISDGTKQEMVKFTKQ